MSNMIQVFVELEDEFILEGLKGGSKVLYIGEESRTFMSKERAEELFNVLDKGLHENTYTDLEDRCLNLESDLVAANELIEELEDRIQDNYK